MDLPYTSRNSILVQFDTEDGISDYSADWDAFSFEVELNTRKNILEEDLKAYNKLLNQPSSDNSSSIDEAIVELQMKKELCNELLATNETNFSKYRSLIDKQKDIKEDLTKLTARKVSLDNEMTNLQEEESTLCKSYNRLKLALQQANEKYSTYFDVNVSTKTLTDTTYESLISFKENSTFGPIKFIIDRVNRKVIDFQPNGILSEEEEEHIRNKFFNLQNLPGLFCALHEIAIKNKEVL